MGSNFFLRNIFSRLHILPQIQSCFSTESMGVQRQREAVLAPRSWIKAERCLTSSHRLELQGGMLELLWGRAYDDLSARHSHWHTNPFHLFKTLKVSWHILSSRFSTDNIFCVSTLEQVRRLRAANLVRKLTLLLHLIQPPCKCN